MHTITQASATPIEIVLSRLENPRRSPRGWVARCPSHEDRFPSLSVAEGRDGRALVNCFAGCTAEEIVSALGLEMSDLFPPKQEPVRNRPAPKPVRVPRRLAELLLEFPGFPSTWEAAKLLAQLDPIQAQRDLLQGWDRLSERIDVPLAWEMAKTIRGTAFLRYADPARANEMSEKNRAVRKLLAEIA